MHRACCQLPQFWKASSAFAKMPARAKINAACSYSCFRIKYSPYASLISCKKGTKEKLEINCSTSSSPSLVKIKCPSTKPYFPIPQGTSQHNVHTLFQTLYQAKGWWLAHGDISQNWSKRHTEVPSSASQRLGKLHIAGNQLLLHHSRVLFVRMSPWTTLLQESKHQHKGGCKPCNSISTGCCDSICWA